MWKDPIVAEVRKAREAYAKRFGYDIDRIFADMRKSEKKRLAAAKKAASAAGAQTAKASKTRAIKRRKAA